VLQQLPAANKNHRNLALARPASRFAQPATDLSRNVCSPRKSRSSSGPLSPPRNAPRPSSGCWSQAGMRAAHCTARCRRSASQRGGHTYPGCCISRRPRAAREACC
jgi:hypothetical protein